MSQGGERLLTFEEFCDFANSISIADLDDEYAKYEAYDRDVIAQGRFADMSEKFSRVPLSPSSARENRPLPLCFRLMEGGCIFQVHCAFMFRF